MKNHFLVKSRNIRRDSYVWNMTGSLLYGFQSVILLMVITRSVDLTEAGIFTIAYANANLFLTIGKYGMRYFQVSDRNNQYSFRQYLVSRVFTTILMIVVSAVYVFYAAGAHQYSTEKTRIIIWMCLFKSVDAIEDIFHGLYQQRDRLDIAAKCLTLRLVLTVVVFSIGIIFSGSLLFALQVATVFTFFVFLLFTFMTYGKFAGTAAANISSKGSIIGLLLCCAPLFFGAFLSFYIGNAPKYAIDAQLTDELQACYGFISMPVFVIGLLNNFIFNPIIYKLSVLWNEGKIHQFTRRVFQQVLIVGGITAVSIAGAWLLGVPVLSALYNTDLSPYKAELIILLLGGGFLGLSGLLNTTLTIIRFQWTLVIGYGIVAFLAMILSNQVVRSYGMTGAAWLYTILMACLSLSFLLFLVFRILYVANSRKKSFQ